MIFDIVRKSLKSSPVLIPVEELLGNATGSRMPEVQATLLTTEIAERIVEVCVTAALTIDKSAEFVLALDHGECIGCGRCIPVSEGAVVAAKSVSCCGTSRSGLVRRWNVETGEEL